MLFIPERTFVRIVYYLLTVVKDADGKDEKAEKYLAFTLSAANVLLIK
jgi:hypothetical protein